MQAYAVLVLDSPHYTAEITFFRNPLCLQVTHSQLRKPGDLRCPKSKQAGVLKGNGLRQGTRWALGLEGQEKVFSYGMTHAKCPEHNDKGVCVRRGSMHCELTGWLALLLLTVSVRA